MNNRNRILLGPCLALAWLSFMPYALASEETKQVPGGYRDGGVAHNLFRPGIWEVTSMFEAKHIPFPIKPKKIKACLDGEGLLQGKAPLNMIGGCHVAKGALQESKLVLQVECPNSPNAATSGALELKGETFTGVVKIFGKPGSPAENERFNYRYDGAWKGECTPG